jgi:uncharacterized cupin superfamily protein
LIQKVRNLKKVPARFIDDPKSWSPMTMLRLGAAAGSVRLYANIDRVKPGGRGIAHQFINDGRGVLEILDCGTVDRGDIVRYPDEGVVLEKDRRRAVKGRKVLKGWSGDPNPDGSSRHGGGG